MVYFAHYGPDANFCRVPTFLFIYLFLEISKNPTPLHPASGSLPSLSIHRWPEMLRLFQHALPSQAGRFFSPQHMYDKRTEQRQATTNKSKTRTSVIKLEASRRSRWTKRRRES